MIWWAASRAPVTAEAEDMQRPEETGETAPAFTQSTLAGRDPVLVLTDSREGDPRIC